MIMSKKDLIRCKLPTRDVGFYLKCQWDPCAVQSLVQVKKDLGPL